MNVKRFMAALLLLVLASSLAFSGCAPASDAGDDPVFTPQPEQESPADTSAPEVTPEPTPEITGALKRVMDSGKLVVGTSPDLPPYEFTTGDGTLAGADIELARHIAESLGAEAVFESVAFPELGAALAGGTIDIAISAIAPDETRAEAALLSDAYAVDPDGGVTLIVRADSADALGSAEAFSGKRVGAREGSPEYELAGEQLPGAELEAVRSLYTAIERVVNGELDALVINVGAGRPYVESFDGTALSAFRFDNAPGGDVVMAAKGETDIINAVNEVIAGVNASGAYFEWYDAAVALCIENDIEL